MAFEIDVERLSKEVFYKAVRSRGPGGQNVNKVSSSAIILWDFENSLLITAQQKNVLHERLGRFLKRDGRISLRSDELRDFGQNKSRCLEKLAQTINQALYVPIERKPTKPTKSSKVKRVETKKKRSKVKELRQKPQY